MNNDHPDDGYETGYCKPPKHSQFKKGQSGNPNGKPKGKKSLATLVQEAAQMPCETLEKGKKKKTTLIDITIKQIAAKAAKGDHKAAMAMIALYAQYGPPPEIEISDHDAEQDAAALEYFLKTNPSAENVPAAVDEEEGDGNV
ncbi:MAG: DUF5681 domain-containing protein [Novosphingobium sp.]